MSKGTLGFILVACVGLACVGAEQRSDTRPSGTAWEISPTPSTSIGGSETNSQAQLHLVNDAARLTDGRIVIAEGVLESRVSVFAPDGRFLSSIGSHGEGPGEYQWVTNLELLAGDSLFMFDALLQRITLFPPEDGRPRTILMTESATAAGRTFHTVAPLAGGQAWVARGQPHMRPGQPGRIERDTISLTLLDGQVESSRLISQLPDQMFTTTEVAGSRGFGRPAFTPDVIYGVWERCVFFGTADTPRIEVVDMAGNDVTSFAGPGELRAVTEGNLTIRRDAFDEMFSSSEEVALAVAQFERQPRTESLPYYDAVVLDQWGNLWLQEYQPPWGVGTRWYVLSQNARLLATVEMPKPLTVYSITAHGVLGQSKDEFGIERVELFPFVETPPSFAEPLRPCVQE